MPPETPPTDDLRTDLADFIRERREELDLSLRQFAERAVDPQSGAEVKYGWIYRLENGAPVNPPRLWQLRALAAAARADLKIVKELAARQFFDIHLVSGTSGAASALVKRADRLTEEQVTQIVRMVDVLTGDAEE